MLKLSTANVGMALVHGAGRVALWGDDWAVSDQEINRVDSSGAPVVTFWKNVLTWVSKRVP